MDSKSVKQIKPDTNKIQISAKRDTGFYVFLAKLFLMDFEEIELHALGDAIGIAIKVGELLNRHGYTALSRGETSTINPTDDKDQGNDEPRRGKKAKLIVKLKKTPKFGELIKNFRIQKN